MGLRNLRKYLDEPGQPPGFVVLVPKIWARYVMARSPGTQGDWLPFLVRNSDWTPPTAKFWKSPPLRCSHGFARRFRQSSALSILRRLTSRQTTRVFPEWRT